MYVCMGWKDVWGFTTTFIPRHPSLSNTMSREIIRLAVVKASDRHIHTIFTLIHGGCFSHTEDIAVGINPYFINRHLKDFQ